MKQTQMPADKLKTLHDAVTWYNQVPDSLVEELSSCVERIDQYIVDLIPSLTDEEGSWYVRSFRSVDDGTVIVTYGDCDDDDRSIKVEMVPE